MSRIVILDNGHGGMIGGNYQTSGKRSPNWDKGVLYEGVFNRWISNKVEKMLAIKGIPYYHISRENEDISLQVRVNRANAIFRQNPNVYLLSIHSNAGGGTGFEGFTSRGTTSSDSIAELFLKQLDTDFPEIKMRYDYSDGDKDKEVDYFILRKTNCPAFLVELLFMDNKKDYDLLWSSKFQYEVSNALVKVIEKLYKG